MDALMAHCNLPAKHNQFVFSLNPTSFASQIASFFPQPQSFRLELELMSPHETSTSSNWLSITRIYVNWQPTFAIFRRMVLTSPSFAKFASSDAFRAAFVVSFIC
jgi:hypothetical protein